ncbi:MAG: nicotinate (nicotinamide) nucleotide adenylyltransferase [Magnetococcales bacterium]|nr:nicotinate (nicotinamide) nucleotide adenylyltransferase [Magnetococcales bacterium]
MTRKTGLLGGTFNPPHHGHTRPAREAMKALGLERVVCIPTGMHPFKGPERLAPVSHRVAMVRLLLERETGFSLWEIEANAPQVSYTVETLEAWHALFPDQEPVLLIGGDIPRELHLWRAWRRILELAHVCLMERPGFVESDHTRCPALTHLEEHAVNNPEDLERERLGRYGFFRLAVSPEDLSSTELRRQLSQGDIPRGATADAVIDYALAHGLYRAG